MEDHQVTDVDPVLFRNDLHQVPFDFFRVILPRESKALGDTPDMSIDNDSHGFPERGSQDDVGGFPSYSRKLRKFFHSVGNNPVVPIRQGLAAIDDISSFCVEKPR